MFGNQMTPCAITRFTLRDSSGSELTQKSKLYTKALSISNTNAELVVDSQFPFSQWWKESGNLMVYYGQVGGVETLQEAIVNLTIEVGCYSSLIGIDLQPELVKTNVFSMDTTSLTLMVPRLTAPTEMFSFPIASYVKGLSEFAYCQDNRIQSYTSDTRHMLTDTASNPRLKNNPSYRDFLINGKATHMADFNLDQDVFNPLPLYLGFFSEGSQFKPYTVFLAQCNHTSQAVQPTVDLQL